MLNRLGKVLLLTAGMI